jgi:hypothetical protein
VIYQGKRFFTAKEMQSRRKIWTSDPWLLWVSRSSQNLKSLSPMGGLKLLLNQ